MATGKDGHKKVGEASAVPNGGIRRRPINIRRMQNVFLIWLDSNTDNNNEDYDNIATQVCQVVSTVHKFMDIDQCIDLLTDHDNEKVIMIISHALNREIIPLIHDIDQLHTIFLICNDIKCHEQWAKEWPKIKGISTEILPICDALEQAAHQCEQNAISISFVDTSPNDVSSITLDRLDPSFMYTQILKEILLTITFEQHHIQKFIKYCSARFADNDVGLNNIKKLERTYRDQTPIWWYTCQALLYSMLNTGLRLMDVDIIVRMGFFIGDLHRHIQQLHDEQYGGHSSSKPFTVYRGQGLSKANFEQLTKTKGGLISFNNFLSTSNDRTVSLSFAESNQISPDLVGILFVLTVDPSQSTTPFASIRDVSHFQGEDEILFSMHSVFRINDIRPEGGDNCLYEVKLTLTSDNDQDLRKLTDQILEESFPETGGWERLGLMLLKMGQFDKAQGVYEVLLDQATNESEKAPIYHALGAVKGNQAAYQEAITFYEKAIKICQSTLPSNHSHLASSYNNIGAVYDSMGDYPKALSFYEKALAVRQQSIPPNHPDLGVSYNNIGMVYYSMGDYPKALLSHKKALAIQQQSLLPNHPDLALSFMNIGNVYNSIGDYPKALLSHKKALAIQQQSLLPNHPHLASSYNNIGSVYVSMGDYPKALSSHEKALAIQQQSLRPNHPDLGTSYINIGSVYYSIDDYPKALSFYEKALAIKQQSLSPDHIDLALSYMGIGNVYGCMSDYPKALLSHEKALAIQQQSLPPNHPHLGGSYLNIGTVYDSMGDYPKALLCHEKALAIWQQSLPPNHPDLGASYLKIGSLYNSMGNYSKARFYYQRAVDIEQHSVSSNYPTF